MIRKFEERDLETVMELWLAGNLQAHSFIPERYWKDSRELVKVLLPGASLYVYTEETGRPDGFIGLSGDYIEGIFVREGKRSCGIGAALLDFAKEGHGVLTLRVYQKNERAVKFYLRNGFRIRREELDEGTGEKEYEMVWKGEGGHQDLLVFYQHILQQGEMFPG